jgi:signal transduction histidine kinase
MVIFIPELHFAYRLPGLRISLETSVGLIALLAAFLVLGRLRQSGRLDDLVLACAFAVIAASTLFFKAVPSAFGRASEAVPVWSALSGSVIGSALLCLASFARPRRLRRPRTTLLSLALCGVLIAIIAIVVATFEEQLPALVADGNPPPPGHVKLASHPVVLAFQLTTALLFSAAAVGFTRRAARTGDEMMNWLAVGAVLAAFGRFNYFLYPSLYAEWVYTGDVFRLLFYIVVLIGAAREIASYWKRLAQTAILDERRRIARDLHDGLAQEITLISRNAAMLEAQSKVAERIRSAADRAIVESRRAIATLAASGDAPLELALPRAAQEVADALGARLELVVARGVRVDHDRQEALLRIAREAIANAVRHGQAQEVHLELRRSGDRISLRVVDDGHGFELPVPGERDGFGLVSMRERAQALGGEVRIETTPGRGTAVEVVL